MRIHRLSLIAAIVIGMFLMWLAAVQASSAAHLNDVAGNTPSAAASAVQLRSSGQSQKLGHTVDLTFTAAFTVYLPLIRNTVPRVPAGIYGQITYQGDPIGDIQVGLSHCNNNGSYWACPSADTQYTKTFSDGSYQFTTVQSLGANQKYFVYSGNFYPYLSVWWGPDILTYTTGQTISGGSFDIANIPLLSPSSAITIGLPVVFKWTPRTATPSDSYHIVMWNINNDSISWQSPPLGYVGSYTMTTLPNNFTTGVRYAWLVEVSNNGGTGDSQETRVITFSSSNQK